MIQYLPLAGALRTRGGYRFAGATAPNIGGGKSLVMLLRALLVVLAASACASSPAAAAVGFRCGVEGEAMLGTGVTAKAVCARLKSAIDREMGVATRLEGGPQSARGDRIEVKVRVLKPGILSGQMQRVQAGRSVALPDLRIAVMDRPLELSDVDRLGAQLGRQFR